MGSLGIRHLRRKVMSNLDSIFKSRDITLPTKFCLVQAIVSPVVMYGCDTGVDCHSLLQRIFPNLETGSLSLASPTLADSLTLSPPGKSLV